MDPMDRVWKEMEAYIQAHAKPDMTEEELNELVQQFTKEYNARPFEEQLGARHISDKPDANDYVEMASQASSAAERRKYLDKALELEPDNLDAMTAVAMTSSEIMEDEVSSMEEVIKKGAALMERKGFLPDHVGDFWGILETRPYMRTLSEYSILLLACGMYRKAVKVMEEMLRLCPEDNIGIRSMLLSAYAMLEEKAPALKLYDTYREMAGFSEDEVLEDSQMLLPLIALFYKLGELDEAARYLKALAKMNSGTVPFLRKAGSQNPLDALQVDCSMGLPYNSFEELAYMYTHTIFLYISLPGFIPWALRVLDVPPITLVKGIKTRKSATSRRRKR